MPTLDFFRAYFEYSPERLRPVGTQCPDPGRGFRALPRPRLFPRLHQPAASISYGRCQYHDICTLDDPAVRQRMLDYRHVSRRHLEPHRTMKITISKRFSHELCALAATHLPEGHKCKRLHGHTYGGDTILHG